MGGEEEIKEEEVDKPPGPGPGHHSNKHFRYFRIGLEIGVGERGCYVLHGPGV